LVEILDALLERLLGPLVPEIPAFEIRLARLRADDGAGQALRLARRQLDVDLPGDCLGNFALQSEDVVEMALVAFRPEMGLVGHLDELGGDANAGAGPADRAFEDVRHAKLPPDLRHRLPGE